MNQINDTYFPAHFISNYISDPAGLVRFQTYCTFRFLSFADPDGKVLPERLCRELSLEADTLSFSAIETYLARDYYFSPSLRAGSFEPFYLYCAIALCEQDAAPTLFDTLLSEFCPVIAGVSYTDESLYLPALLQTGADFYGALVLILEKTPAVLPRLLPQFTEAYHAEYHFTCEDFLLFDFMDEYFEQRNCKNHPSFMELTDTLVAATLNYHNTDFDTILENEAAQNMIGTGSRYAGIKRIASVQLSSSSRHDDDCRLLAELFRYAALYELRNNLFDFHLDDDKLITLDNWKEQLHWHYVQYSNVYELALSTYQLALLSKELMQRDFADNIRSIFGN